MTPRVCTTTISINQSKEKKEKAVTAKSEPGLAGGDETGCASL
jgi:hypothetical protein